MHSNPHAAATTPAVAEANAVEPRFSMSDLLYAPVELGTIRIGGVKEKDGRRLPVKHDYFTITSLARRDGEWIEHPIARKLNPPQEGGVQAKLRDIPVRMMFDSPDLSLRARFEAHDVEHKRPVCASTWKGRAMRMNAAEADSLDDIDSTSPAFKDVECVGPDRCPFAQRSSVRCKHFGRLSVQIEGQSDPDNTFVLRTASYNTLRGLEARLWRYWALFGRRLRGLPLTLQLRTRTTGMSHWQPFFFLDLAVRSSLAEAMKSLKDQEQADTESGLDWAAFEKVARAGMFNGGLSEDPLEGALMEDMWVDEPVADWQNGAGVAEDGMVTLLNPDDPIHHQTSQVKTGEGAGSGSDAGSAAGSSVDPFTARTSQLRADTREIEEALRHLGITPATVQAAAGRQLMPVQVGLQRYDSGSSTA